MVSHKDALDCTGKGRRGVISINGRRYRVGTVGGLAGVGTDMRPVTQAAATLAAKILGSGNLALVGLYSSFQLGTGGILATGDNRAIVSGGYYVSQLLGSALALTLLIFGVMALYAY